MDQQKKIKLESQGYRLIGTHSAIKVCSYCKESLRDIDVCYKEEFYGIKSHRCCQMTPSLDFCNLRCKWCWRDIIHTKPKWSGKSDDPKLIIDECIKAQAKYLQGFKGNDKANKEKFKESLIPNQFAISLAGEPTFYKKLPFLIKEIKSRGFTAFLVTNGTNPSMLRKLMKKKEFQPTNLYITLPAPDFATFKKCCRPLLNPKKLWNNINKSLKIMKNFTTRKTIRLTLAKDLNFKDPEKYAKLIKNAMPDGIEVKAYMWVGYSQKRLSIKNMPSHEEIKKFAEELNKFLPEYKITKEKQKSRVLLIEKIK